MDFKTRLAKAKTIPKPKPLIIATPDLVDYIGGILHTPLGDCYIRSVDFAYTRRVMVNNKYIPYRLYTITLEGRIKRITTYAHTQWIIK
jgi:hypothetical protein